MTLRLPPSVVVPLLLSVLLLTWLPAAHVVAATLPPVVQQADEIYPDDGVYAGGSDENSVQFPARAQETPVAPRAAHATHTVAKGDTLYAIARRYGLTVSELMRINQLNNALIYVGQVLRVASAGTAPPGGGQTYTVVAGDTLYSLARRYGTTVDALRAANGLRGTHIYVGQLLRIPAASTLPTSPSGGQTHIVVKGDTLYAIARRYGTTVDALLRANGLRGTQIYVGQLLRIPISDKATRVVVKATPTPTVTTTISTPTTTVTRTSDVIILDIFYDGQVADRESDEYAMITNLGLETQNLDGWRLYADDRGQDFLFPDFDLGPGESCRVYTDEIHTAWCGFSYESGSAIWNNEGDCGRLFDADDVLVHEFCYDP